MNLMTYLKENAKFELDERKGLNTSFWKRSKLKEEVRKYMTDIADAFVKFMNVSDKVKVVDYLFTGSLANYTWHEHSDVDLHILVEVSKDADKDDMTELFMAKKAQWNAEHGIEVMGMPVEMYVQPVTEKHASSGVYSLKKNEWIVEPKKTNPSIDEDAVISKASKWKSEITDLIKNKRRNVAQINKLKKKLRDARKRALDRDGEFAIENLAFKILRNEGFIKKLYDYSKDLEDELLSS